MTIDKMNQKKEHNSVMIEIASFLKNVKFDDVKYYFTTKYMRYILIHIDGGVLNLLRAKEKILRGQYDEMKMKENENIVQYVN